MKWTATVGDVAVLGEVKLSDFNHDPDELEVELVARKAAEVPQKTFNAAYAFAKRTGPGTLQGELLAKLADFRAEILAK